MAKSNVTGYDITKNPIAPQLLFEWGEGVSSVYVYTPTVVENIQGDGYILSWSNNAGLPNPSPIEIKDGRDGQDGAKGTTYVPMITPQLDGYLLEWSNDGGRPNPDPITLRDGATFIPHVTPTTGGYILSWTNNNDLPNPQPVTIYNGSEGVPTGGTTGQVLTKKSGTDYDVEWKTPEQAQTPVIGATASVTESTGTPSVNVTKSGTDLAPIFAFAFAGLKGEAGVNGTNGTDGDDGVGIVSILYKETDASGNNVYTVSLSDSTSYDITCPKGANGTNGTNGTDGVGISSITFKETDSSGNNVYTVTLTNSSSYDITAPRGPQGQTGPAGADGSDGEGVPTGGTTGQVLAKASGTDYDTEWVNPSGGSITGGYSNMILVKKSNTDGDYSWVSSLIAQFFDSSGTQIDSWSGNGLTPFRMSVRGKNYNNADAVRLTFWRYINQGASTQTADIEIRSLPKSVAADAEKMLICNGSDQGTSANPHQSQWVEQPQVIGPDNFSGNLKSIEINQNTSDNSASVELTERGNTSKSISFNTVPSGGTAGQFLVKGSSTDGDYSWVTVPSAASASF